MAESAQPRKNNQEEKSERRLKTGCIPEEESHPTTAVNCNLSILRNQDLCDVIFIVGPEEKEIKCHKIFLMARSPYFKIKFSERWSNTSSDSENLAEVHLPDDNANAFEAFIEFIYTDKFSDNLADVMNILPLAHFYDVLPLVKKCEEVMTREFSNYSNTFEIYQAALMYSMTSLINNVENFIGRNISTLATHPISETLDEQTLIRILSRNNLQVEELQLFKMIRRWAEVQMVCNPQLEGQDEGQLLKNLIPFVRFPIMSLEEFANEVVPTKLLPDDQVLDLFMYFSTDWTQRNSISQKLPFSKEFRGIERTIALYPDLGRPDILQTSLLQILNPEVQIDMLSFSYHSIRCPPRRNVMLTGLVIRGPGVQFFKTPSIQNIYINIGEIDPEGSLKLLCCLTTKIEPSVTTLFEIPTLNDIPLYDGRRYQIIVFFDACCSYKSHTRVQPNFDPLERKRLRDFVVDQNLIGAFGLHHFQLITFLYDKRTQKCKSPLIRDTYGMHVVRELKLAYC